jgi:hypothetical protein
MGEHHFLTWLFALIAFGAVDLFTILFWKIVRACREIRNILGDGRREG